MMLAAIAIIISMAGFSQFKFGVQAIGNISSATVKSEPNMAFTKTMVGLPGAGVVAQYDASEKISVRSGINYLQHGVILESKMAPTVNVQAKAENTLHYLQLPVNVVYYIPVGKVSLFAGAGGFVNYGVDGTSEQTTTEVVNGHEIVTVEKLKAFKKEDDGGAGLKKFDFGAGALAGVKLSNGFFANLGYQLSLTNISQGGGKYKNQGLLVSVGYFF